MKQTTFFRYFLIHKSFSGLNI